jgi:uncharacterized protein
MSNKLKSCEGCKGACCKYIAIEIDTPETIEDFSDIRWYVAHKNVNVYVEEDGTWNVEFLTPCEYLSDEGKCTIHEDYVKGVIKRPAICREFITDSCPYHNEYNELFKFEKMEDVDKYIEKIFNKGLHTVSIKDDD